MKNDFRSILSAGACLLAAVVLLTGCVGYRVGSMLPPDINSVHIPTFVNKTTEPLIEVDATREAISEFQKDGSLKVIGLADADAVLDVTLVKYDASPIGYEKEKATSANEYRLTLTASLVLKRKATVEVITECPRVQGDATFVIAGDFTSSKQTALKPASRDLAHHIVERVVEAWQSEKLPPVQKPTTRVTGPQNVATPDRKMPQD